MKLETTLEATARPAQSSRRAQAGKVGKALLLWMLGVPGSIVALYLIFGH